MFHWGEVQNALFWEVASLEKLVNQLDWSPGKLQKKKKPHTTSPNHLILPVKIAQYSFWQKTLNKAFPGSVEVIRDGYMLKCKKLNKNNVLYKTTTPHVYQNMNIVLWRNLGASWHLLGKKKTHDLFYKSWLSPSRGDLLSPLYFPPKNRPVLDLTVPLGVQFLVEMKRRGSEWKTPAPHLRPAPPPPAMKPLSNRRLSRAAARRHHSGPWFLWFRWYCNNK